MTEVAHVTPLWKKRLLKIDEEIRITHYKLLSPS
jgi:hypothetical protein